MTRAKYMLFSIALNIFLLLTNNNPIVALLFIPVFLYLASERFVDIGMTRWWLLGVLIPGINLYPLFNLTFASSGYKIQDHVNFNKVDGWHAVGFIIWASTILLMLAMFINSYV